jgi:hypothetical protein
MGTDGPQAEENTIAADAHHIAPVPCDEKEFFVFLAEALKKQGLSGCKKKVLPKSAPLISIQTVLNYVESEGTVLNVPILNISKIHQ